MSVPDRIYNRCIYRGLPPLLSSFVTAQSAHETGGWTSAVFIDCNACFGYKWIGQSTAAGPCLLHPAYAAYNSIEQSTDEIVNWIFRRQRDGSFPQNLNSITTSDQYATLLKNAGYFEDTLSVYMNGLRNWLSQLNLSVRAAQGAGILVVGGVLVYVFRKKLFRPA